MKILKISITEWQHAFLCWVADGCPKEAHSAFLSMPQFIRSVGRLKDEGMIIWNTNLDNYAHDSDVFKITDKGRAVMTLWKDNFKEE